VPRLFPVVGADGNTRWETRDPADELVSFNVKDFGAKGDGVTDDKTAIQRALDAAGLAGGGTVFLGPGTYLVSSQLAINLGHNNVTLRGAGKTATTIKLANGANTNVITYGTSSVATDVTIADLTVDGNKANQTATSDGIVCNSAVRPIISNVRIVNAWRRGINFFGCTDPVVFGCELQSCGDALSGGLGSLAADTTTVRARIINNHIETPGFHGIAVAGTGCVISGNTIRNPGNSGGIGIAIAGSTDCIVADNYITSAITTGNCIDIGDSVNGTIRGNVCVGGRTGIDWDSGANAGRGNRNTLVGNIIHGSALNGIGAAGNVAAGNGTDATIIGNYISGYASNGIAIDGITNGVIVGNTVKSPTAANPGIVFRSTNKASTGFLVSGNRCYDDQGSPLQTYGIQSLGTCDFLTITGNDVRGNVTAGMSLVGSNNKVRNNTGYATEAGGTSTQTPGAVATVNIAHGLAAAPTNYLVLPGDANARGEPTFFLTADATNIILNFSANLAAATSYTWRWRAEV
jgi:Pectate lyase superfamily protein/Right handed beta helix region